jgi:hypothetical protein
MAAMTRAATVTPIPSSPEKTPTYRLRSGRRYWPKPIM